MPEDTSPRPWRLEHDRELGWLIRDASNCTVVLPPKFRLQGDAKAILGLIVHAVNQQDALLEACEGVAETLDIWSGDLTRVMTARLAQFRAALAKAREGADGD